MPTRGLSFENRGKKSNSNQPTKKKEWTCVGEWTRGVEEPEEEENKFVRDGKADLEEPNRYVFFSYLYTLCLALSLTVVSPALSECEWPTLGGAFVSAIFCFVALNICVLAIFFLPTGRNDHFKKFSFRCWLALVICSHHLGVFLSRLLLRLRRLYLPVYQNHSQRSVWPVFSSSSLPHCGNFPTTFFFLRQKEMSLHSFLKLCFYIYLKSHFSAFLAVSHLKAMSTVSVTCTPNKHFFQCLELYVSVCIYGFVSSWEHECVCVHARNFTISCVIMWLRVCLCHIHGPQSVRYIRTVTSSLISGLCLCRSPTWRDVCSAIKEFLRCEENPPLPQVFQYESCTPTLSAQA